MSHQKKKGKKKTPSSSKISKSTAEDDEFADVVANDDDGSLSSLDCLEISKLIFSTGKQLNKTATAFFEVFKNRCSLTVGSALITFYDVLSNVQNDENCRLSLHRVIIIYLIYRVRELEPALKRKQEKADKGKDSIMGHPFIDFFLGLAGDKENNVEMFMAGRILSKRGNEFANSLPIDIVKSGESGDACKENESYSEIEQYLVACQIRWPVSHEYNFLPSAVSNCGRQKPDLDIESLSIEKLAQIGESLLVISSSFMPPKDLRVYDMLSFLPVTTYELEHNPKPGTTDRILALTQHFGEQVFHQTKEETVTETSTPLKWNVDITAEDSKGQIRKIHCDADIGRSTDKIINGQFLSPIEQRVMHKYISECPIDSPVLKRLRGLNGRSLRKFIEDNIRVASEVAFKIVSSNPEEINNYMSVLLQIDVSVQCLELVRRLYECIPNLDTDLLRQYIYLCIEYCQLGGVSHSQQARTIRMVCMFVTSLLKHGLIKEKGILAELQQFVLKNREVREATVLYQIIANGCTKLSVEQ